MRKNSQTEPASGLVFNPQKPPYYSLEGLEEWAQIFLEKNKADAETIAKLIDKVFTDGIREGRERERAENCGCIGGFHGDY